MYSRRIFQKGSFLVASVQIAGGAVYGPFFTFKPSSKKSTYASENRKNLECKCNITAFFPSTMRSIQYHV